MIKHLRLHTQFISNMLTRGEMLSTRLGYDLILPYFAFSWSLVQAKPQKASA